MDVNSRTKTTGFERYDFIHNALPEINYASINIETSFLNINCPTPFFVSAMSGGASKYRSFNENIAIAAQAKGWGMSVGSMRSFLEKEDLRDTFNVRKFAPDIPLLANIGAVQLNYGLSVDDCKFLIESIEADSLVFHLNSIQEVIQPEGDRNFSNLYKKIYEIKKALKIPIGVKEVGWGINKEVARRLKDIDIDFIDVAGAGGTSWSEVEKERLDKNSIQRRIAEPFSNWGNPTSHCLEEILSDENFDIPVIASGGIDTGLDAAKAYHMGATAISIGKGILSSVVSSPEDVKESMSIIEEQMKIVLFATGNSSLHEFKNSKCMYKI